MQTEPVEVDFGRSLVERSIDGLLSTEMLKMTHQFPPLPLTDWQPTLRTLQHYAQLIGKVRRALTPAQKHWWHVGLQVATTGLTTTPIPADDLTFDLLLDLTTHHLVATTNRGEQWRVPLTGQSPAMFCDQLLTRLSVMGLEVTIDRSLFADTTPGAYDPQAVERYWSALSQLDGLFKQFKGSLREETGPVMLWPHHIDLALLWFSGRLVPGQDPTDEEHADEQMNFGFSPGDEMIADPYFYITAYPQPVGWQDIPLPAEAVWLTEGFSGAVMRYEVLVVADKPGEILLNFLQTVQQAGAKLMNPIS